MQIAYKTNDLDLLKSQYDKIASLGSVTKEDKELYKRGKNKLFDIICKFKNFTMRLVNTYN